MSSPEHQREKINKTESLLTERISTLDYGKIFSFERLGVEGTERG
jgi:hypothetical protein